MLRLLELVVCCLLRHPFELLSSFSVSWKVFHPLESFSFASLLTLEQQKVSNYLELKVF